MSDCLVNILAFPMQQMTMIKAQAGVKNNLRRLNKSIIQSGSNHIIHVILFALVCFFVVYLWSKMFRKWVTDQLPCWKIQLKGLNPSKNIITYFGAEQRLHNPLEFSIEMLTLRCVSGIYDVVKAVIVFKKVMNDLNY